MHKFPHIKTSLISKKHRVFIFLLKTQNTYVNQSFNSCPPCYHAQLNYYGAHCFHLYSKGKGKLHPRTGHEGPEVEQMYSSTLPSTSVLDGGGRWSAPRSGRFTPGKDLVPVVQEAGWATRAGLDRCGKSRLLPPYRDSIPGPSIP
jgi:hypothetical protein